MDHSASAMSIELITEVMAAYSLEGSYEAAGRKNCILSTWNGVGRPHESALLNLDFVEWCHVQKRIYGDSYQIKVSRLKTFTFGGWACPELSQLLSMGDYMSLGTPYNVREEPCQTGYFTDLPVMLNPDLQNIKQPAGKLSNFFKDLMWYAEYISAHKKNAA